MRKQPAYVLAVVFLAFFLAGGLGHASGLPAEAYPGSEYVISPAELHELLGEDNLRIYDLQDAADYAAGHVPGAMHFDVELLTTDERFAFEFDGVDEAAAIFGAAGISTDDTVVLYWGDFSGTTYTFWALKYLGHPDVRILNGGIEGWKTQGYELSAGFFDYEPTVFEADVQPGEYASLEWVQERIDSPEYDFVDARPLRAYEQGHLPAANDHLLVVLDALNEDGFLRGPEELTELIDNAGLDPARPTVTYCTRGRLASQLFWVLKVAGFDDVRNFEASMLGWEAHGLPVATGSP